jgi:hypothetical protein
MSNIAIVGAGLAGLSCAQTLVETGCSVVLFDKGRAAGGRCATRRSDAGAFDHGAQYFTARDSDFAAAVRAWRAAGVVQPWGCTPTGEERLVAVPGMSALPRHLAAGLELRCGRAISALYGSPGAWRLRDDAGQEHGPFAIVLLTLPVPQARVLLAGIAPGLVQELAPIVYAPCWSLLAAGPGLAAGPLLHEDAVGHPAWACRLDTRPGRDGGPRWILHASVAWSRAHLEDAAEAVAEALLPELAHIVGADLGPLTFVQAHRWRYARVETALGRSHLFDRACGLGYAGDGCLGPRLEAAWLSGRSLGHACR